MKVGKASIALVVVAAAMLLAGVAVAWLNRDDDAGPAGGAAVPPARSAELIARGEYLVRAGSCFGCHTEPGGAPYAGGRAIETPFGIVHAPNLTPDATGLAAGAPTTSGARCTTAARATAASSIRRFRIRTTRASRAPMPTRCSPT